MKVLLWKEFYEKRLWGLLWAISIILPLGTQANLCSGNVFTNWLLLPVVFSFVMGVSTYAIELKENRVDFIYSQPISWTKLLLAKAFFGLAVILLSSVLAAVVFRVICPDYYIDSATPSRIAHTVGLVAWWLWTLYLSGLFFSVVLPGMMGSLIVFLVCLVPIIVLESIGKTYIPANAKDMFDVGKAYVLFIGPAIAALMTLRFGLTLPLKSRAIRYGLIVMLVIVAVPALSLIVPKDVFVSTMCNKNCNWSSISPDGDYALVHYRWCFANNVKMGVVVNTFNMREADYLVRLSDGKETPLNLQSSKDFQFSWVNNDTAYYYSTDAPGIRIIRLTPGGKAVCNFVKLSGSPMQVLPSSDGSVVIIASKGQRGVAVEVLNIKTGKTVIPSLQQVNACWWESSRQVGYIDSAGKRRMLQLH